MSTRTYYCLRDDNCRFETMTKTQILQAISKAVNIGVVEDVQAADAIFETNRGNLIRLWVGSQAEYNNITEKESNVLYIISDDTSKDDLIAKVEELIKDVQSVTRYAQQTHSLALSIHNAQNNIDAEVQEIAETVSDVETEVAAYEAAVAQEQQELQLAQQAKQTAGNLARQITGGTQTELFNGTVKFDQPKTITLTDSAEDFNKLAIVIKIDDTFYYTTEIFMSYYGTSKFFLGQEVKIGSSVYNIRVICKFDGSSFIIDDVLSEEGIKYADLQLSIYGIV